MINISICASNKNVIVFYKKKILSVFSYNKCTINLNTYTDCLEYYEKNKHIVNNHIVFLVLKNRTAEKWIKLIIDIRKYDRFTNYIIISDSSKQALDGYKINAFDYLVEPVDKDDICNSLKRLLCSVRNDGRLEVCVKREKITLNLSKVLYFESINRRIIAHTLKKRITFYGVFSNLAKDVIKNGFIRCHQSFIVNLKYIDQYKTKNVMVSHEDIAIPITRSYRADFKKAYLFYNSNKNTNNLTQLQCIFCEKKRKTK